MSEQNWLRSFPQSNNRVYPTKGNEPNDYYQFCPRIRANVLVDRFGNCLKQPKFPICGGCICLSFRDVTEEQLKVRSR